jgi:catechol 2,3-dioxygenase-like lactoylglutathione lyase family enzyme
MTAKEDTTVTFRGICLLTTDVPKLVDFYAQVLQLPAEGDAVHSAFAIEEHTGIAIWNPGEQPRPDQALDNRKFVVMLEAADVDAEYLRLKQLGIAFKQPPTTQPWGSRSVAFDDPDGNQINIYTVVKEQ